MASDPKLDPRFVAVIDMIGRTGARNVQIRYCEEEKPVVWMVVAEYKGKTGPIYQVAAGMQPYEAGFRLLESLLDGGKCTHCSRPTGVTDDFDPMPLDALVCWYQWDPELKTFRRGCEGQEVNGGK